MLDDQTLQEIKKLRADIEGLPERIVTKLLDRIEGLVKVLVIAAVIFWVVQWAINRFWK